MQLVKTGTVANLGAYANVELHGAATALKYATAIWKNNPGVAVDPLNPTNTELAVNYQNRLRQWHKEQLRSSRVSTAASAAVATEEATVAGESTTELGGNE